MKEEGKRVKRKEPARKKNIKDKKITKSTQKEVKQKEKVTKHTDSKENKELKKEIVNNKDEKKEMIAEKSGEERGNTIKEKIGDRKVEIVERETEKQAESGETSNNKTLKNSKKAGNKEKNKIKFLLIPILIAILLIFSVIFAIINIGNEKILGKVSIMGIDVSNMTREEAKETLSQLIENKLTEEIILKKDDYETSLNANQLDANFDLDTAVNEALNIGREGNIVKNNYSILYSMLFGKEIECKFNYNEENLNEKLDDIESKLPGAVVQSSYYIEDESLIIVKGEEGLSIKKDELKNTIINEIKDIKQKYDIIEIPTVNIKPDEINLEDIKNEIYKEPQDAYITENPTTVHTHVNGVDFAISLEEAEKILAEDKQEYTIPLKITVPDKTIADLGEEAFPDELGKYSTRYDPTNKNRSNNISISTEKIDGTIIMPGETFSYNQTVGERTIAEGYKEAGAYAGGRVVQDVGGGICQTSSTLYNAVLLANLEIVDRSNHQFLTSYVDPGRDATVAWGAIDFKFKNNRSYPIKIEASSKNGVCMMSIHGIKEETEYEVTIQSVVKSYIPYTTKYENDSTLAEGKEVVEQSGYRGCTSEAYRILKQNGEVVSKTLLSKDTYDPMTRIIKKGTKTIETNNKNSKNNENNENNEKDNKDNNSVNEILNKLEE